MDCVVCTSQLKFFLFCFMLEQVKYLSPVLKFSRFISLCLYLGFSGGLPIKSDLYQLNESTALCFLWK